jgi:hypothetical protein
MAWYDESDTMGFNNPQDYANPNAMQSQPQSQGNWWDMGSYGIDPWSVATGWKDIFQYGFGKQNPYEAAQYKQEQQSKPQPFLTAEDVKSRKEANNALLAAQKEKTRLDKLATDEKVFLDPDKQAELAWLRQQNETQLAWAKEKLSQEMAFEREKMAMSSGSSANELAWLKEKFNREEGINPYEQASIDFQNKQLAWQQENAKAQAEAEKQSRLSQLRANPYSWLQYASEAGETPAVQPWMLPLMPQQYMSNAAGSALPGWTGNVDQPLSGLPELTRPGAQYFARMNPSSQKQYSGYETARTGATAEDIAWRRGTSAPPSGYNPQLSWAR